MERAGDYRRSTALMWTGLVLLSMQFARQQYRLLQTSETNQRQVVRYKFSPTHRRCNDVCQQLWWTQPHSTASLEPRCDALSSLQNYEQRTAHHGFAARRSHIAKAAIQGSKRFG
jgi:hypothetical protein